MIVRYRRGGSREDTGPVDRPTGARAMKWETPQATDFRFGMEITMYVANR
jgi:coenzyme PQQ precursor peptide PqqA